MSQVTSMANCDVITIAYRCWEPRIKSWYVIFEEKFERKQLRHFSWIRSGLKIPVFSHIAPIFCVIEEKSTNKLHCNNLSWMATCKHWTGFRYIKINLTN